MVRFDQTFLSNCSPIHLSISFFHIRPLNLPISSPLLKIRMAGTPIISYLVAMSLLSSVSILMSDHVSLFSKASPSKIGSSILQGSHQVAQKSTITGFIWLGIRTIFSNSARFIIKVLASPLALPVNRDKFYQGEGAAQNVIYFKYFNHHFCFSLPTIHHSPFTTHFSLFKLARNWFLNVFNTWHL